MQFKTSLLCASLLVGVSTAAMADFSGFYIGPQVSYTWMNTTASTTSAGETDSVPSYPNGFSLGPHVGWAYQMNEWVFALEGTYSGGSFSDKTPNPDNDGYSQKTKVSQIYTVAPLVGYTEDSWLFYGKAGYASGNVEDALYNTAGTNVANDNQRQSGWLAGLGLSYMLNDNNAIGLEYDYMHFGSTDLNSGAFTMKVDPINVNTLSLNYTRYFW